MNRKEISEIKKQFTPDKSTITRICGCYVDSEKNKRMISKDAFYSLPEEDAFKYFTIFRQTLSGTVGKNLMNMDFPLAQESDGGTQEFLLKLRNSKLEDDDITEELYDKIIGSYDYAGNYYILLIHAAYDIPGKASDGSTMDDASDDVYEYILCSICPVTLSKPGLSYYEDKNRIENRVRDWIVDAPATGFLFPEFNERFTDIHSVLYFSKKAEELQPLFIDVLFGVDTPMSAGDQKELFNEIITDALGEECDFESVKNIHINLTDMIEEHKDSPEPLVITKNEVKTLLEKSDVDDSDIKEINDVSLVASNVANTRQFDIKAPDVIIKVNPERADLIETREIDGRQCLVITVDDHIEVNGVRVKTLK